MCVRVLLAVQICLFRRACLAGALGLLRLYDDLTSRASKLCIRYCYHLAYDLAYGRAAACHVVWLGWQAGGLAV